MLLCRMIGASAQVDAPLAKVYRIWANRINYNEWFDLIGQVSALKAFLMACIIMPWLCLLQDHVCLSPMPAAKERSARSDGCA